jgi:hypothetical protein
MGGVRDGFSNFKFFEALAPQSFDGSASVTGATVDKQGYETLTFIVHAGEISGIASALTSVTSCAWVRMQDGESNAAGTVVWANCQASDIQVDLRLSGATSNTAGLTSTSMGILNVSNAGSGLDNGTFFCLGGVSADNQSFWESQAYAAGYIGDKRWIRVVVSVSAAGETSAVGIAAIAVLGLEANWPVNTVRKTS